METNELKNIWKTLAKEKLIGKEMAEENIERIISLKSCNTVARLNRKLKFNSVTNAIVAILLIALTLFVSIFKHLHNQIMPLETYAFLFLAFVFFFFRAINYYSKIKLLSQSSTTKTIKDSLSIARSSIEKVCRRDLILGFTIGLTIVIFGNVLLNEHTDFENFNVNSLQGYVMIFSIIGIILSPFTDKRIIRKKFSGIINDITNSLKELEEI